MIQVFMGTLIFQLLMGIAFDTYFYWGPRSMAEVEYSLPFNGVLTLVVLVFAVIYLYMLAKQKDSLEKIDAVLKSFFKYTFIVNVMAILLAQICLLYTNKTFVYFLPQYGTEARLEREKKERFEREVRFEEEQERDALEKARRRKLLKKQAKQN